MTTSHDLTTKKKIVDAIQRMPEDATIDNAINRLRLLKRLPKGFKTWSRVAFTITTKFSPNS
jgi:hypothetical protein